MFSSETEDLNKYKNFYEEYEFSSEILALVSFCTKNVHFKT